MRRPLPQTWILSAGFAAVILCASEPARAESPVSSESPSPAAIADSLPELNISTSASDLAQLPIPTPKLFTSYFGIGGNIGIDGDTTPLGTGGFAPIGKVGFARIISLRGSAIIDDDTTVLAAVTFDFPLPNPTPVRQLSITPYFGGGIAINSGEVDPLITAGVDFPLTRDLTATVQGNLSFPEDDTDIGVLLGLGYNFNLL